MNKSTDIYFFALINADQSSKDLAKIFVDLKCSQFRRSKADGVQIFPLSQMSQVLTWAYYNERTHIRMND